jgi:ABC-2 type transport system ATP-binding protein
MKVTLHQVAKHFGREVVFEGVGLTLANGSRTALLGPNGSGKSTLLQVISGAIIPTQGHIEHHVGDRPVPQEEVYKHVSIAAPYLGLYEELSLTQAIEFHARFKPFVQGRGPHRLPRSCLGKTRAALQQRHEATVEAGLGHPQRHALAPAG